jgi:hypothetical protein
MAALTRVTPAGHTGATTNALPEDERATRRDQEEQERTLDELLAPLLAEFAGHRPEDDTAMIVEAGRMAQRAHEGQLPPCCMTQSRTRG